MPPGRRDPPAFLIYIRGRWRSVPPGSGFAVARSGRLEELHSGTVRGALRRLQLRLPSKARLGPRLSFKKIPPSDAENSDNNVTLIEPKQMAVLNRDHRPSKRTRDTTSSEEPIQSVTTVATVHAAEQCKTSKNYQSKEFMESPKKSSSSILLDSPKKSLSLRRKPVQQTNSSKQNPILKSKDLSEKQISRYLQPRREKHNKNTKKGDAELLSDSDFQTDQSEILKSKKIDSIFNSEFSTKKDKSSSKYQNKYHENGPKRQKLDQDPSESESPKKAQNIFQRPNEESQTESPNIGTCHELVIDERDIELLRIFLQNHYSDRELLKFDADDEYKRMIFYRINPLVNIEWCPTIDRMLHRRRDSQITLSDFASSLGLRSVSEAASIKTRRYKIRKRTEKSYVDTDSDSSSEDKENNDKMPRRIKKTKILKERERNVRESSTGDNKAKESKDKVGNKKVLTRKRAESDSEESNSNGNNKKAEIAQERTTRANHNTVESESEVSNAKENSKKTGIAKTRMTRTNHNIVESDSENNNNTEKAKYQAKTENRITVESDSEASIAKENNKKPEITKKRTTKANHDTEESDSEASNAKENNKKVSKKQTKREVRNKEDTDSGASNAIKRNTKGSNAKKSNKRDNRNADDSDSRKSNAKRVDRKEIDNTVVIEEISSESDTEAVKAVNKTAKPKPVISTKRQRTNNEYSTLEDHAIVAWVSNGSRASRVNGNLLWRQLQDQYKQITGSRRTWHSLRNRYLRYILPKLGNLALPLSQQARLRAAAATGEIKGRKIRSPRRNSIFALPPRGASSRRPGAKNYDTEIENEELSPNRSPRYSSLTRQFTRRQNMARASELSDTSQRSNKLEVANGKEKSEAKGNSAKINSPRKNTNGKDTSNAHSDSDRRSESPRRDKDSSDSSSESEDESKKTNEPRRTTRSANDADKRISRSDTGLNTTESKRRLTRQSNILDVSDESKSRKSRGVADRHKTAREKTNESPRRNLNRHKSPSEKASRESSESMSQSRRKSPVNNRRRSRRDTKTRDESDDESNDSKRRKSPIISSRRSPTRKSNRNNSPSKQSSKGSNTSVSQVRRNSNSTLKRKNTRHDSTSEGSDSSSGSVSEPRRKSNRINSPNDRSNRRKSNRLISPMKQNGRLSSDSPRRKSNRLTPNESSNKRRHSSESKRKSKLAKRDSLDVIVASDSSESLETKQVKKDSKKKVDQPKKREVKQKMRRLFNPKTML